MQGIGCARDQPVTPAHLAGPTAPHAATRNTLHDPNPAAAASRSYPHIAAINDWLPRHEQEPSRIGAEGTRIDSPSATFLTIVFHGGGVMKNLAIKVVWPDQRSVNVTVRPHPLEPVRSDNTFQGSTFIPDTDIQTRDYFITYLHDLTRRADEGSTVEVDAWEQAIDQIYDILDVEFPPPKVVVVNLPATR
jgi:hypothetical protein